MILNLSWDKDISYSSRDFREEDVQSYFQFISSFTWEIKSVLPPACFLELTEQLAWKESIKTVQISSNIRVPWFCWPDVHVTLFS